MSRYDLSRARVAEILGDGPRYRVDQLWEGLYRHLAEPDEITALPRELRDRLAAEPEIAPALRVDRPVTADGGLTEKWLSTLADGALIETVLMHHPRHSTVCVSSQAGCAMACTFCATGQAGFGRQLAVGEIVEQVVVAARGARATGRRLDNVVFMGMGEPLANYASVLEATRRIVGEIGIGARHVTISTVGVVPGIRRLASEPLQVNLAVSLHGANDVLRSSLVPLGRRYPLAQLVSACEAYVEATHRRISFEWALIAGINDRASDASELAAIARPLHAHVNIIPLNPTPGYPAIGTAPAGVRAFRDRLTSHGVNATVRQTKGRAIDAACGQLAAAPPVMLAPTPGAPAPLAAGPEVSA
ncbi:MAG TPA: 23S rRNA (adenine(2503)-C(2))-methyltransferase RlmN [Acidimicrobiales bacterium]|nr:23S rRNA (adenine(2503)-C(2))-methyltransferase RlmN [Acidimicrobiales bacterium]